SYNVYLQDGLISPSYREKEEGGGFGSFMMKSINKESKDRVGVTDGKCRNEALTLPMSTAWCLQLFGVASISSRGRFDSSQ
ncbi:Sensor histidine kinase CusS, partial [Dissostichus eleginoides]